MAVTAFVVYLAAHANSRSEILPNGRWKKSLRLGGVAAGVFTAVNLYFIQAAGLRTWLYCLIVYPLRYYPSPTINNWRVLIDGFPSHAGLITWAIFSLCMPPSVRPSGTASSLFEPELSTDKDLLTGDEVWLRIRAPAASCRH